LVARVEAEREVIGQTKGVKSPGFAGDRYSVNGGQAVEVPTTLPATSEAKQWEGWGTALKPAFEPVVVGRKPFGKGVTVAENVLAWGVGGLNIDGSRIASEDKFGGGAKATSGFVNGYENDGWQPGSAQGRWPANVILDEVTAGLLDEQSGVSKSAVSMRGAGGGSEMIGQLNNREDSFRGHNDQGGASRFFYVAKASRRDRNEGLEELEAKATLIGAAGHKTNPTTDKPVVDIPRQNFHPTVKPTQLMRYLIKLVTPEGGVVLDPFTGSGSTGKAALLDGFQFVGVELTEEYLPIIEGRLRWASEQVEDDGTLF
jgi:site-specific DNA-methyltransferase (adenine-specific)